MKLFVEVRAAERPSEGNRTPKAWLGQAISGTLTVRRSDLDGDGLNPTTLVEVSGFPVEELFRAGLDDLAKGHDGRLDEPWPAVDLARGAPPVTVVRELDGLIEDWSAQGGTVGRATAHGIRLARDHLARVYQMPERIDDESEPSGSRAPAVINPGESPEVFPTELLAQIDALLPDREPDPSDHSEGASEDFKNAVVGLEGGGGSVAAWRAARTVGWMLRELVARAYGLGHEDRLERHGITTTAKAAETIPPELDPRLGESPEELADRIELEAVWPPEALPVDKPCEYRAVAGGVTCAARPSWRAIMSGEPRPGERQGDSALRLGVEQRCSCHPPSLTSAASPTELTSESES